MGGPITISGPDFSVAFDDASIAEGASLLGHVGDEPVIVVRDGGQIHAVSATCSHYGGPLAEGLVAGGTVRCPWHHACFDLRTGQALGPALAPIACFDVQRENGLVRIGKKKDVAKPKASASPPPTSVVIVGAGPAGAACAVSLRQRGYEGPITLIGAEHPGPVDRPNLSKDYLAGAAPEEWIPLRTKDALAEERIELIVSDEVQSFDGKSHSVTCKSGRVVSYGVLVIATGAAPAALSIPGADLPHVHALRTLDDVRAILTKVESGKRAVIIGAGFIGLEAAASLRARGLEVTVVAPDAVPLVRVVGEAVGRYVQGLHEAKGSQFRLQSKTERITTEGVVLASGETLPADLIIVGVGVRPRVALAEEAGLRVENGIVVDADFRVTGADDVYAIGDVARYPYRGELVRVEHFAVALRHGQRLAEGLLGQRSKDQDVPYFWSQHGDVALSYVGHAEKFDEPVVIGDLAKGDALVVYRHEGAIKAILTVNRDAAGLAAERAFEVGDTAALEALLQSSS